MTQSQQNNDKKLYQTLKDIRKSLLNQPRNIELIFKQGYVLYLLKKYKMAADAFSHAIQIKPGFVEAYNARSIAYHELGKFTDAIIDCEQGLKINPEYKEWVEVTDNKYNVDLFLGIGGGPEGVLAASALEAYDCYFQGKFLFDDEKDKLRAKQMGIKDLERKYYISEIVSGDSILG